MPLGAPVTITREQHEYILLECAKPAGKRPSHKVIADKVGIAPSSVSRWLTLPLSYWNGKTVAEPGEAPPSPEVKESDEHNGNERILTKTVTERIKTLAELAEVCEIDTAEWEVYKWKCVAWQTGMKNPETNAPFYSQQFSVSAWMRLKPNVIAAKNEIEELRKRAEKYSPKYAPFVSKTPPSKSGNMVEISIVDHHFAGLIWGKETGHGDWDLPIAQRTWNEALDALIEGTRHTKPESILLVVGNDQLNSDNRAGTTERGTPQRNDSRYQKGYGISRDITIQGVERCLTVAKKVIVMPVPGNHDPIATWHLGDSIRIWFRNNANVEVRNEPRSRKYIQHGVNMLMFAHGNAKKKLENYGRIMAAEEPKMWGATKWHEAHTADKHQRRLLEFEAYAVRILPSLRPPCDWSADEMLIGAMRAAEAYAWNKDAGLIGTACHSILDK